MKKALLISLVIILHLGIMYFGNFTSQNVREHHAAIFFYAYSAKWYEAPIWVQKLYLFLMIETTIDIKIILGFYTPSLEGFFRVSIIC
ncbi:uncharacterized protein [Bombus fervidus]|uniref:uncharacterized protein n=1 Tax=Bombus fervidus TaxID=203811 RepID=UPI003D18E4D9